MTSTFRTAGSLPQGVIEGPSSTDRSRRVSRARRFLGALPGEWCAPAFLVALAIVLEWDRLSGPAWIGMDTATAFFPWYTFLGDQLRSGHIPVWNPHTFSGAPFAADPESGWMYLPAMLAFTLLNLDAAVRGSLLFHVLLAALSTYALARNLGLNTFGALLAATVYAHSGFFEGHNVCCYAYADVAAWLPLTLLGAERAICTAEFRPRLLWSGVSALAFSQILAAWIGQGAYYAALVLGGYVIWRGITLGRARLASTAVAALAIGIFALGLGAAGVVPRLEYNAVSSLPGGYPSADVLLRATSLTDWGVIANVDRLLLQPGFEYIGWPVVLLAIAALPLLFGRERPRMLRFFALLGVVVLILARAEPTPLHALFSLLPGFERIHARSPERALIVFWLAPAMLSGAALSWLTARLQRFRLASVCVAIGLAALSIVNWDLHTAWIAQSTESLAGGGDYQFALVDLAQYLAPTPGARFLMSQSGQFRYFGYVGHVFGGPMPYTLRWTDPSIAALQVNNRALLTGLEDIQGYNPVHVARYDEFVTALNGQDQNYHHADVFDSGFDSPLLDLLGVRYVVLPSAPASDELLPSYNRSLQQVYADETVRIFENPSALPRAWLVHGAVQGSLDAGIDFRHAAVLDTTPPALAEPPDPSQETVAVEDYAADHIRVRATATAAGLLVLSEVAYPAWHAYLDGQQVQVYVADGALRAVAVPTGEHVVELRYESLGLQVGLLLSAASAGALLALAILHIALQLHHQTDRGKSGARPALSRNCENPHPLIKPLPEVEGTRFKPECPPS